MENAITTTSLAAIIEAGIARLFITIITFFDPDLENAVTTASVCTIVATSVVILDVSIIACFYTRVDNPISADRQLTPTCTKVFINLIAVITVLTCRNESIATARLHRELIAELHGAIPIIYNNLASESISGSA